MSQECILEETGIPTEASALITALAAVMVVGELGLAGLMYVSVAAPDRVPERLAQTPLWWRMVALLGWSVMAGVCIQLAGVLHSQR